jgi:transposase
MAQKGQPTTFEERIEIGERWEVGQSDAEIATAMMRSVWTVRKWRRRYHRSGRSGLVSRMGRPPTGALGQSSGELRQKISQMRKSYLKWGPVTIRTELEAGSGCTDQQLPSRSRIAAYLRQEGFSRRYERLSELPQPKAVKPERAHEIWEVDAQGVIQIAGLGAVSIINIKDLFSRLNVDSHACLHTSHPSRMDYHLILRRAFVNWGLPEQISLDHDSVFYDNARASPYPTVLHLWLIALGIAVRFIQEKPPLEHSVIERAHQTVDQQAITGQSFIDSFDIHKRLSERLDFLNLQYPSLALGGQAPLMACPEAKHTQRPYRLEWEAEMLDCNGWMTTLPKGVGFA